MKPPTESQQDVDPHSDGSGMRWSLKLGTVAGIGIYVHWTFVLIVAWIAFVYYQQTGAARSILDGVLFIFAVFACIVLHELGHALTARRFGIQTRDITLLPIGGMARLQRMPEHPTQELLVAVAGPVVTFVIALVLLAVTWLAWGSTELLNLGLVEGNFWVRLMWVNAVLLGFNLLPAFPMDGGRVLRAILHYELDYVRATQIASNVGQVMAIGFGVLGLFSLNLVLLIVAAFVFIGAQQEAYSAQVRAALSGLPVRDIMETNFRTLSPESTVGEAIDELLDGEQKDFPVIDGDRITGLLTRQQLVGALRESGRGRPIRDIAISVCDAVEDDEMLDRVFERMQRNGCSTLPVVRNGGIVGIITNENVGEWVMIQSALRERRRARARITDQASGSRPSRSSPQS